MLTMLKLFHDVALRLLTSAADGDAHKGERTPHQDSAARGSQGSSGMLTCMPSLLPVESQDAPKTVCMPLDEVWVVCAAIIAFLLPTLGHCNV